MCVCYHKVMDGNETPKLSAWMVAEIIKLKKFEDRVALMDKFITKLGEEE